MPGLPPGVCPALSIIVAAASLRSVLANAPQCVHANGLTPNTSLPCTCGTDVASTADPPPPLVCSNEPFCFVTTAADGIARGSCHLTHAFSHAGSVQCFDETGFSPNSENCVCGEVGACLFGSFCLRDRMCATHPRCSTIDGSAPATNIPCACPPHESVPATVGAVTVNTFVVCTNALSSVCLAGSSADSDFCYPSVEAALGSPSGSADGTLGRIEWIAFSASVSAATVLAGVAIFWCCTRRAAKRRDGALSDGALSDGALSASARRGGPRGGPRPPAQRAPRDSTDRMAAMVLANRAGLDDIIIKPDEIQMADGAPHGRAPSGVGGRHASTLGRGGMGEVRLGLYQGAKVALKRVIFSNGDEDSAVFVRECQMLLSMRHPNIVAFFGIVRAPAYSRSSSDDLPAADTVWLMAEEYCSRGSLKTMLKTGRLRRERHFAVFANDLLSGLAHMHKRGIVHRDLKPGNLVIGGSGHLQICDFGTAKQCSAADDAAAVRALSRRQEIDKLQARGSGVSRFSSETQPLWWGRCADAGGFEDSEASRARLLPALFSSGGDPQRGSHGAYDAGRTGMNAVEQNCVTWATGTPAYTPPEVIVMSCDDECAYSGRKWDVYSAGLVLWQMWTRTARLPFACCRFPWEVRRAVVECDVAAMVARAEGCAPGLASLLRDAMDHDPSRRPDAAEALARLQRLQGGRATASRGDILGASAPTPRAGTAGSWDEAGWDTSPGPRPAPEARFGEPPSASSPSASSTEASSAEAAERAKAPT
jgi:serine/threonine protein kinase